MKRILLSVFAAALTAAWAVPAMAGSVDFSGQYRLRGEWREMPQFQDTRQDQSIYLQRVRLTANAQATSDTSVKITLQDSWEWGKNTHATGGPGLTDGSRGNTLDLHESYVLVNDLFGTPISAKIGRQELNYGDQRLIGAFGWNNSGRSFDAIKFTYGSDTLDVDFFTAKINEATTGVLPNSNGGGDADQDFYGLHATIKAIANNTINVYGYLLRDGSNTAMVATNLHNVTPNSAQTLFTYGTRIKGKVQAFDYTGEVAFQTGSIPTATTDLDLKALAYALKAGYSLPTPMKVRVGAQYVFASGDADGTDNELETFSNLFPTNHGHMGYADQQAWRNVAAWAIEASAQVNPKLGVKAAYWSFELDENADDWYHAGRWMTRETVAPRLANNADNGVGSEIDLVATYKYSSALTAQLGYSLFSVGDLVKTNVLNEEDMQFGYLQLTANF